MKEKRKNKEIERKIDSGLFACLLLFVFVVFGIVVDGTDGHNVTSHWIYYPVLFASVCILWTYPSFSA